jgi:transcriptional regulator with XRE-family HTH domain
MNESIEEFGARLRRHREQRKIPLDAVAERTKIARSLLASLERGDLSHWPGGIFRRAFLREYAATIGLPAEAFVAECQRLFPEPVDGAPAPRPTAAADALRLTYASDRRLAIGFDGRRLIEAAIDGAVVLAIAIAVSAVTRLTWWPVLAATSLIYSALGTVMVGRTIGSWVLRRRPAPLRVLRAGPRRVRRAGIAARDAESDRRQLEIAELNEAALADRRDRAAAGRVVQFPREHGERRIPEELRQPGRPEHKRQLTDDCE